MGGLSSGGSSGDGRGGMGAWGAPPNITDHPTSSSGSSYHVSQGLDHSGRGQMQGMSVVALRSFSVKEIFFKLHAKLQNIFSKYLYFNFFFKLQNKRNFLQIACELIPSIYRIQLALKGNCLCYFKFFLL